MTVGVFTVIVATTEALIRFKEVSQLNKTCSRHALATFTTTQCSCVAGDKGNVTVSYETSHYAIQELSPYSACSVSMKGVARGGAGLTTTQAARTQESGEYPENENFTEATDCSLPLVV